MEAAQAPAAQEGPDRRPRAIDQVWAQRFLIAVRCQHAGAERERSLRRIEKLNVPCREEYLRHRRDEIVKEMNKPTAVEATVEATVTSDSESDADSDDTEPEP
jgi:hypothetical protein